MKSIVLFQPLSALRSFPEVATDKAVRLPFLQRKQLLSVADVLRITSEEFPLWPLHTVDLLKLTPWQWEAEEKLRSKALVVASEALDLYLRSLADYSHDHTIVQIGDLCLLLQLSPQTLYGLLPNLEPLPGAPSRIQLSTLLRLAKVTSV